MSKVFIADSNGRVSLRKVSKSKSTLEKEYVSAGKHYVYRRATFNYDPVAGKFYWLGAKRKNRRFGHKSEIFVRLEPAPTRKAIPVQFDTYFYPASEKDQPSPFPELHKTFYVTVKAREWEYQYHDFGTYEEPWRVGLLSDITHRIMYNRGKNMTEGEWKLWRIPEYDNKVDVRLPEKRQKGTKVIKTFEELIKEIRLSFDEELAGGEK